MFGLATKRTDVVDLGAFCGIRMAGRPRSDEVEALILLVRSQVTPAITIADGQLVGIDHLATD